MMPSYGETRAQELDGLAARVRAAGFLSAQLLVQNAPAMVQNCMYFIDCTDEMKDAASHTANICVAFAQTLRRDGVISSAMNPAPVEALRARSLESIKALQRAIQDAKPSVEATCLGLG